MAICPHCGREIPDDVAICPYCGAQVSPDVAVCGNCGKIIPADAKVCPYCGAELSDMVKCPNCGREIPADSKSCPYCGYRFDKDHPLVRIEYKDSPTLKNKVGVQKKVTYSTRSVNAFSARGYGSLFILLFLFFGLPFGLIFTLFLIYPHWEKFGDMFFNVGLWIFILAGALYAAPMAYFLRDKIIIVRESPNDSTINKINVALAELGYYPTQEVSGLITYKPSLSNGLAAGKIALQKERDRLIITGPHRFLKKLIKKMNWERE